MKLSERYPQIVGLLIALLFGWWAFAAMSGLVATRSTGDINAPPDVQADRLANDGAFDNGAPTFHGYACTDDCSGHRAGWEWAADRAIEERSMCENNSQSFQEGCEAWFDEEGLKD